MWNLSGIISLSTISIPFSLSSPSGTPIMCRLLLWMLSHSSHRFFHAFFILFSSLSSGWLVSIFLSSASKILLLLLMLSVAFSILLHFMHCNLKKEFLFDSFSFSASLHSFRDLSSLTRTESRHSSERIESQPLNQQQTPCLLPFFMISVSLKKKKKKHNLFLWSDSEPMHNKCWAHALGPTNHKQEPTFCKYWSLSS